MLGLKEWILCSELADFRPGRVDFRSDFRSENADFRSESAV